MDQRQLEKERIRLTREISMLESQLSSAQRGKEEKIEENKQIKQEIEQLEEENKGFEEETRRLDEEIAALDEEFKQAQLDAGRLRREIKVNIERSENEKKQVAELRNQISKLEQQLESLRREIKNEIEERRNLESKLRKTNAHIDAMKQNRWSAFVTRRLEKQDWYQRMEEPMLSPDGSDNDELVMDSEVPKAVGEVDTVIEPEMIEKKEETKKDEGGIDFGMD